MKKVIFILVALMACSSAFAQVSKKSIRYPYVDGYGWSFHLPVGGFPDIGQLGFVHIEADSIGHVWLKYNVIDSYDADDFVDEQGRRTKGRYSVPVNKHMYLKLDNDEIVTLTCFSVRSKESGYQWSSNDIHTAYDTYSYFILDKEIIKKLSTHNITKMRVECKYDIIDAVFKKDTPNFTEYYNDLINKLNNKKQKDNQQKSLNNNPLMGF